MSQTNSIFTPRLKQIRRCILKNKSILKKYRYILIFGVSIETETALNTLKEMGIVPVYIIDNDISRRGQVIQQIPITSPNIISDLGANNVLVVLCGDFWNAKLYQLEEYGLKRKQIFSVVEKRPLFGVIKNIFKGVKTYKSLKNNSSQDLVFLHYSANGDAFIIGLYLRDYFQKNNLKEENTTIVVVRNSLKNVLELFGFSNFKVITDQQSKELRDLLNFFDCRLLNVHYMHYWGLEYQRVIKLCNHNDISFLELVVHAVFGKENLHIQLPQFIDINSDECKKIIQEYELVNDKTVLLAPYANTYINELEPEWWNNLVLELNKKGYQVFTNAGANEEAISGTSKIFIPFNCLAPICEYCGSVIGMRSGLFDVLAFSTCRKIIIYQDIMSQSEVTRFSLENMYEGVSNLYEYKLENTISGKEKCKEEILGNFN